MSSTELFEDAATYVEKNKIFQLFESLLQDVVVNKPDKPIDHLIKLLKRDAVPKIVVAGPPGAQARSLCELMSSKTGLVHVIASDVWRELARLNSEPGLKIKALHDAGEAVPSELLLEVLKEKLTMGDCVSKGWILEGFPSTKAEARSMLAAGLLPTRFLHVAVSDVEAVRRLAGRRVDPQANVVYHLEDSPPPDAATAARLIQRADDTKERVAERLMAYRQGMAGVLPLFKTVSVELDGSGNGEAGMSSLVDAALKHVTADMPSRAPRGGPRVLLLGGPGSNLESVGSALAEMYGAKHVSAYDLLHGASLNGNKAAAKAMASPEPLVVGESTVAPLVLERLKSEDVRRAGFVLTGFYNAGFFKKHDVWIRHAVVLDLPPKAAKAIVTNTRYDPVDGETYHLDISPPDFEGTRSRLLTHPKDTPQAFEKALKTWKGVHAMASKAFASQLVVESAQRPERQIVERLSKCFLGEGL